MKRVTLCAVMALSLGALKVNAQKKRTVHSQRTGFLINGVHYDDRDAFVKRGARCSAPRLHPEEMIAVERYVDRALEGSGFDRFYDAAMAPGKKRRSRDRLDEAADALVSPCDGFNPPHVVIPVAFHVIVDGDRGKAPVGRLNRQLSALNRAFSDTGFSFVIASVDYTDNASWYAMRPGSMAERRAKQALAVDPHTTLNIYIAGLDSGLLGWASFPADLDDNPVDDGVVVLNESLPGGGAWPYNLGDTAVHEVGHWLGLYHTFQGGCGGDGDFVADTPPEGSPASGCPTGRDSCRRDLGEDSVFNYMNYTDDACMNEFTPCQIVRMHEQAAAFRIELTAGDWP